MLEWLDDLSPQCAFDLGVAASRRPALCDLSGSVIVLDYYTTDPVDEHELLNQLYTEYISPGKYECIRVWNRCTDREYTCECAGGMIWDATSDGSNYSTFIVTDYGVIVWNVHSGVYVCVPKE